ALLQRLTGTTSGDALRALLGSEGALVRDDALSRTGAREVPDDVISLGPLLYSPAAFSELQEHCLRILSAHHRDHPLENVMPRETLRAELGLEPAAFDDLIRVTDEVVEQGAGVRLTSHSVGLSAEQARARDAIVERIEAAGFQPPLASELNADPELVRALTRSEELVKIDGFYLTAAGAARARAEVRAHIEARGPVTVAQIRDLLGTTRKYAVPLCEWLDATGATLRRGDQRILGPNP
ncbi:MAG: SelB C-terminal domain-containing protein, partial [Actinobacteria bacterium]|nr:SelB C-terminal domain-containing protein [Actinomycetota bacterium]